MRVPLRVSIATLATVAFATEASADDAWQHDLTAMVWASGLEGRESIGPIAVDLDASFSDLLEFVDVGGAFRYTAERDRIQWFLEASFVDLSDEVSRSSVSVRAELGQTIAEGGLAFDINDQLALYGGARYQALDVELSLPLQRQVQKDVDWIDAIAGAIWTPLDQGAWSVWLRADVGAGGSDFQWLAEAGVKWRFATAWSAQLAYRTLDVDYEEDGFGYDMRQSGMIVGITARF
jgi:opacity protein-like surface antigen